MQQMGSLRHLVGDLVGGEEEGGTETGSGGGGGKVAQGSSSSGTTTEADHTMVLDPERTPEEALDDERTPEEALDDLKIDLSIFDGEIDWGGLQT
jgi:hypothetical protein